MSLRGGYIRDILNKGIYVPNLLYTSSLDLENEVPIPTSRHAGGAKKFHRRDSAQGTDHSSFPIYLNKIKKIIIIKKTKKRKKTEKVTS